MERWRMSRAGILNFWCYDDEELVFEEGRMILRGANGSGKSVTMQSLLPLVLDGDKRPERLDPFGSRDRRMEYYLLGEAEKGHTDRTGYLWIEFYHPAKNLYKTIGIGLRARRGVPQLGFWGFLLEDGRRINQDFFLYDRVFWLEHKRKLPLNRKALEEKISTGGQVVQEQTAYRDMVNKALFDFREEDAYRDLLKLLLELRSPKLSKDFKPSSIYEILTRALPPLKDEELSSLTGVIEDMDQIADELEELQLEIEALRKIERSYDRHNRFLLYQYSRDVLAQGVKYDGYCQQLADHESILEQFQERQKEIIGELERSRLELMAVEAELVTLESSEEMNRKRELEILENQKKELDKRLAGIKARLDINRDKSESLKKEIEKERDKLKCLLEEQGQSLGELDELAQEMEFHEHNIYHRLWSKETPEEEQWAKSWVQDLAVHKQKLASAQAAAREEKEASNAAAEAERKLGEASRDRGLVEKEQAREDEKLEDIQQKMKEDIVGWHQSLKQLRVSGDQLREILGKLMQISIKNRSYEIVRHTVAEVHGQQSQEIMRQLLELEQQKKIQVEKGRLLEDELQQWRLSKEPEPTRTEERISSRRQRSKGTGAALYAACEFSEELSETERAQLEATLTQAGILDAWILPGGKVELLNPEHEEVWIEPTQPIEGKTLADVLYPMPPAESGLSEEDIRLALSCFGWSENENRLSGKTNSSKTACIGEKGSYRLGPLAGSNLSKSRAEYIGAETRRRTKELEIARLESDLEIVKEALQKLDEQAALLKEQLELMQAEMDRFPGDEALQQQLEVLYTLFHRLSEKIYSEQKAEEYFKQKLSFWREMQVRLVEQTANWSRIKKEPQISEAMDFCQQYQGLVSGLRSSWTRYRELSQYLKSRIEQQADLLETLEEDEEEKKRAEELEARLAPQITQLRKLMEETGIEDIYQQIQQLKDQKRDLNICIEKLNDNREKQAQELGGAASNVQASRERMAESRNDLDGAIGQWRTEWRLALVLRWKELTEQWEDEKALRKGCKQIVKEYEDEFRQVKRDSIVEALLQEFGKGQSNLHEYALTKENTDSGRILISSKRDRMNPLSPAELLNELTALQEEQQALLSDRDRALYEEIIIGSVGKAIRNRIHRARDWVSQMDALMKQQNNSSGLKLSLKWIPLGRKTENELDTESLVELLMRDAERMDEEEINQVISHFRARIQWAKQEAQEEQSTLRRYIYQLLDYRSWFEFRLEYRKGQQSNYAELTDSKFNALSGGEKAMSMYIPLFAATYARYSDAGKEAPRIISLDEAFAGVDETNMREMFHLLTDMGFDYIMTSQVLWGCYDTVPHLAIYEIYRPKDADVVTLFHYRWNGERRVLVDTQYE